MTIDIILFNIYTSLMFRIRRIYFYKNIKGAYLIITTGSYDSETLAHQIFSVFDMYSIVDEKSYWFYAIHITLAIYKSPKATQIQQL